MRLKLSLMSLVACSLIFTGCKSGPKVTVNVSDPQRGGMEFYDQRTGKAGFSNYSDTDRYICFSPVDTQTLLNYCGLKGK